MTAHVTSCWPAKLEGYSISSSWRWRTSVYVYIGLLRSEGHMRWYVVTWRWRPQVHANFQRQWTGVDEASWLSNALLTVLRKHKPLDREYHRVFISKINLSSISFVPKSLRLPNAWAPHLPHALSMFYPPHAHLIHPRHIKVVKLPAYSRNVQPPSSGSMSFLQFRHGVLFSSVLSYCHI
jgi:hypothetical protein